MKLIIGRAFSRRRYNQIARYVIAQSEINIAIGDKSPSVYFKDLLEQYHGGKKKFGGITYIQELKANFEDNCIPNPILNGESLNYDEIPE